MPRSSNHSLSAIAYGSKAQPQPDWRTAFTPPPNRLQHLDYSRQASLDRKIESAALAETLLLDWLKDQSLNTISSQLNLGELNRATRILYRLTGIQKTLMNMHEDIVGPRRKPDPASDPPLEPLDDDPDDDDSDDDDAGSADALVRNPVTDDVSAITENDASSLGPRTASSPTPPTSADSDIPSPNTPHSESSIPPLDNPQSNTPQSPIRACSVRAVPTLPLDQVEAMLDGIDAELSRLTHAEASPSPLASDSDPVMQPAGQPIASELSAQAESEEQPSAPVSSHHSAIFPLAASPSSTAKPISTPSTPRRNPASPRASP